MLVWSISPKSPPPGVDCIVSQNHQLLFRCCRGVSDLETTKPLTEDALYYIFSMTKMLTCTAATPLGFVSGSHFRYSLCHDVLGAQVEIWSGQGLGAYIKYAISAGVAFSVSPSPYR